MLTSFNLPSKNLTTEKQMALMRNYMNQLKDETETELYDIKWDNLNKDLKDKINNLDKDIVATNDNLSYIQANAVTTSYLESNYASLNYLTTQFVYAGAIAAGQITSGYIDSSIVTASLLNAQYINVYGQIRTALLDADCVNANLFVGQYINADYIDAATITSGLIKSTDLFVGGTTTIAGGHIDTNSISAATITSVVSNAQSAYFGRLNIDSSGMYLRTSNGMYRLSVRSVNSGGNTIYFLGTTTQPI